ncbi:hypothetical protein, partial [Streptomyces sp. GbtcB6]|uniref:hypothetical protein n=1 Tax=Streptomyces sp. GbtcB6 TaxID=2824751 RepID=UPI001C3046B6
VPANKELLDRESEAKGIQVDPSHAANEEEPAVSPLSEVEDPVGAGTSGASKIAFRGRSDLSEEARDTVDNSTLPLPKIPAIGRSSESPARET